MNYRNRFFIKQNIRKRIKILNIFCDLWENLSNFFYDIRVKKGYWIRII